MVVRELITLLGFKLDNSQAKKYDKQVDTSKKKTESMTAAFMKAQIIYNTAMKVASGVFSAVKDSIFGVAAETERYRVVLGTMIGDQEKANQIIHDLDYSPVSDFYGTANAIGGLQGMVTFGMQAEEASEVLTRLADVAQGNSEAFVSMSNNMGQVFAKGKADATDLKQFVMQGFDVVGEVAKQTGKSRAEIEKAGVTYEQTASALRALTSEGGKYFGMLEKQANTYSGLINQFKSFFAATGEAIGTSILEPLKDIMRWTLNIAKSFQDHIVNMGTSAFKSVLTAVARCIVYLWIFQDHLKEIGVSFEPVKRVISDVFSFLGSVIENAMPFLENIAAAIIAAFGPIEAFVKPVLESLGKIFADVFGSADDSTKGLAESINGLTPALSAFGEIVGGAVEFLYKLKDIFIVVGAAMLGYRLGTMLSGGVVFIQMAATNGLTAALATFGITSKIAAAAQWILNAAMSANPVSLIIALVVALIAIIVLMVKNWDKVGPAIKKAFSAIGNFFKGLWEGIKSIFSKIAGFVKSNLLNIVNVILTIIFPIGGIVMALVRLIIKHWDTIKAALVKVFTFVVEKLKFIWGKILGVVKGIIDKIKRVWETIVSFITNLADRIKAIWQAVWNKALDIVSGVIGGIKAGWNAFTSFITGLWEGIKNTAASIWDGVKNVFFGVVEGIKNIWNGLVGFFTGLWDALKESPAAAIDFIKNAFFGLFENIKNFFFGFIDKIKEGWETVKGFFGGIKDGVVNFFTGGGEPEGARSVNDLIVTPEGQYSTHPDDYIMAMKNPGDLIDSILRFFGGPQPQPAYAGGGSLTGNAVGRAARETAYNSSSNVSNISAPINVRVDASGMTPDMASAMVKRGVEDALREAINGSRGGIPSPEARRN